MTRALYLPLLIGGLCAAPAVALPVRADLAMRSDYRDRGLSVTGRRPVLQASATIDLPRGTYALLAASPIGNGGRGVELAAGAGLVRRWRGVEVDLSVNASLYPGRWRDDLFELGLGARRPVGPVEMGLSFSYAPPQRGTAHGHNLYSAVSGRLPLAHTPFALRGAVGFEAGALGHGKGDWAIGADVRVRGLTLAAEWVGSARTQADPMGRGGLVFSLSRGL